MVVELSRLALRGLRCPQHCRSGQPLSVEQRVACTLMERFAAEQLRPPLLWGGRAEAQMQS